MQIDEERIADALVLHAAGRIDGSTAPAFERALLDRLSARPGRMVVDLADVEYISSAGLRAILLAAKRGKALGCALALCRLREPVREVFDVSGFGNVVAIHTSLEEALQP